MTPSVFISYSRRNRPFADRLNLDLKRAGLEAGMDSEIHYGKNFEQRIIPQIERCTHLILLASPEANASDWVNREVDKALEWGKEVIPLRLTGKAGDMQPKWEKLNFIEQAAKDYWGTVRKIATQLKAPQSDLFSLKGLLEKQEGTVADAMSILTDARQLTLGGQTFAQLPVFPSAYGMVWLFAPIKAPLRWPDSLGVMFNYTGEYPGSRYEGALAHWCGQVDEPWLLMIEGPVNYEGRGYKLEAKNTHEWIDSRDVGVRTIETFGRGRKKLGFYFNYLLPLAFEVGLCSTMVTPCRRVYHFNFNQYEIAFDGW